MGLAGVFLYLSSIPLTYVILLYTRFFMSGKLEGDKYHFPIVTMLGFFMKCVCVLSLPTIVSHILMRKCFNTKLFINS